MAEQKTLSFFSAALGICILLIVLAGLVYFNQAVPTSTETPELTTNAMPTEIITTVTQIQLTIESPTDQSTVTSSSIYVKGKTVPNAEVEINDHSLTADDQGNFSLAVTLEEGDNYIDVIANDQSGQAAEKEIVVYFEP